MRSIRYRWWGAALGLLLGAFDAALAHLAGVEIRFRAYDAAPALFSFIALSFAAFGWTVGRLIEALRDERSARTLAHAKTEEVAEARVRLAQTEKLASLGQLSSAIAHEVRNPLAIIRSSVQNLAESLPPGDQAVATAHDIMEEIDRLTRVTAALLSFARPLAVQRAPIRAREILDRADLLGRRVCESRSISLTMSMTTAPSDSVPGRSNDSSSDATIDGDRDLLCQALIGILDNAAALTPSGGHVTVDVTCEGAHVTFAVSDTGPGVPIENRGKIFEPFFTTRPGGHGLGLAIVRQIVEAHGGKIEVGDRSGGGARFVIRLPRRTEVSA